MNKDEALKEVSNRNTVSFEQALKELTSIMYEQKKQIDGLNDSFASLQSRLNDMEQKVILQKIALTGLGPSCKS